jgi:hypothetical protein
MSSWIAALTIMWYMGIMSTMVLVFTGDYITRTPNKGELRIKYYLLQTVLILIGPIYVWFISPYWLGKHLVGRFD